MTNTLTSALEKTDGLQDLFLARVCQARANVTMFLMNGFQMRGRIIGFDSTVVVLMTEQKQQVIYKHAISTIVPEHALDLREDT